jgi:hypothetical protein
VGRAPSERTIIRRELERTDLTAEQRMRYIEMLVTTHNYGGAKKGNKPPNTGKVKKPSRNFSEADILRLRGGEKPKPAPQKDGTLSEFLKDDESKS